MDENNSQTAGLPCLEQRILPDDRPYEVVINYVDDDCLWVMLLSEGPMLDVLDETLNSHDDGRRISSPCVNQAVSALNADGVWYRARVLRGEPDIWVQFIDYGDVAIVTPENLAPLSDNLLVIPPLGIRIRLPPDSTIEPVVGHTLNVKHVCNVNGVVLVDIINVVQDASQVPPPQESLLKHNVADNSAPTNSIINSAQLPQNSASQSKEDLVVASEDGNVAPLPKVSLQESVSVSSPVVNSHVKDESDVAVPSVLPSSIADTELKNSTSGNNSSEVITDVPKSKQNGAEVVTVLDNPLVLSAAETRSRSWVREQPITSTSETTPVSMKNKEENAPKLAKNADNVLSPTSVYDEKSLLNSRAEIGVSNYANTSVEGTNTRSTNPLPYESDVTANDPFMSALGRYPHLGGGYGPDSASHTTHSQSSNEAAGDYFYAEGNATSYQSSPGNMPKRSVPITKGRNPQNFRPFRPQDQSFPPGNRPIQAKVGAQTTCFKSPQKYPGANASQDFKTILEFELAIIREQNRLQMLQLQKKMDQTITNQVKSIREEMTRQLAAFRNEVNSRLMIINDSVVHKMADFYSDITMLKNEQELMKQNSSDTILSNGTPGNTAQPHFNIQHQINSPHAELANSESHQNAQQHFQTENNQEMAGFTSNFPSGSNQQAAGEEIKSDTTDSMKTVSNRLMALRKEKMMERDHESQQKFQAPSMHQQIEKHSNLHSGYSTGQHSSSNYPKMDHFDPSKTGLESNGKASNSKGASSSIICASNLDAEKINPDRLFNLFSVYGFVLRVKIMPQDKCRAYIEMGDSAQAAEAIHYLNGLRWMGLTMHVSPSNFDYLKMSKQEFVSNTSKDFTKPQMQRLNRFKPGAWSPQKSYAPSAKLVITNVLSTVSDEKVKEEFSKKGFYIQNIFTQLCSNDEKKILFVTMSSIDEAVNALSVMHLTEVSDWMVMRISFGKPDKR